MASTDSLTANFEAKRASYFDAARRDIIDPLPSDRSLAILELGCGAGATGALALREGKCGVFVGLEEAGADASEARFALTDVIVGDLAKVEIPYPAGSFDIVIAGAALATLADPRACLARLVPLMRPGARLFATIPAGSRQDWPKVLKRAGLRLDQPKPRKGLLAGLFRPKPPEGAYELRAHKGWRG